MNIRPILPCDLAAIAQLEAACFSAPWSESSLALLLTPAAGGFVALDGDRVVGYVGFLRIPSEWEITNIAVLPSHRRQGLGRALMVRLLQSAPGEALRVSLDVRVSNTPARSLYRSLGFTPCGLRKHFYSLPREDGEVWEWLAPAEE